ncbi:hypothetical protein [Streptomyces sp. NPDC058299]|uniref:hypothetical protein n=1 Tax=unclassified Streptomyces TaxID=2593676 RepID=UPI0036E19884
MSRSEHANVPPPDLPIHDAALGRAAAHGDLPALVDGRHRPRAASGAILRRQLREHT